MPTTHAGFNDGNGNLASDLLVRLGPTVRVDIGFKPNSIVDGVPDLQFKKVLALVDTGAGENCIDSQLATQGRLPEVDERTYSGIGGMTRVKMYMGRIYIPSLTQLIFQPFAGAELRVGGQEHHAILGRTFLRPYTMLYNGMTGAVEIGDNAAIAALMRKQDPYALDLGVLEKIVPSPKK